MLLLMGETALVLLPLFIDSLGQFPLLGSLAGGDGGVMV